MTDWIITEYVAWYGALLGTLSLVLVVMNYRRDRTKLSLIARADMRRLGEDDTPILWVSVANTGRRPVVLENWPYFKVRGDKKYYVMKGCEWEPKTNLAEGEKATTWCKHDGFAAERINYVVVTDATGRQWKAKIGRFWG
jgi:hypothetical protein